MFIVTEYAALNAEQPKTNNMSSCQKDGLYYLFDNTFIRLCSNLYRHVLIMFLLLQISFACVMRDTSCCLYLAINKLVLLKHSTLLQDIEMTY